MYNVFVHDTLYIILNTIMTKPTYIAKYFEKLSIDDLQKIPDIGPTVARSIYDWFHDKHNLELLEKLDKAGIEIETPSSRPTGDHPQGGQFQNKIFVLTGELESLTRDEAKAKIRELGGDVSESVSKNTGFVVVGKNPGSKYEKAKKLGIKIVGEKEFLRMAE